jgi:hypothetical protein
MKSILIVVLIISIIIIFFFLNHILKKNIENYGVYCGLYNTSSTPESSCNNDTECLWNSNLAYCANQPSTYVAPPSIFDSLESDFNNIYDIVKSGPEEIEQELADLQKTIQNDANIASKNVTSVVKDFDNIIFSNGSPINTEEENNS